MAGVRTDTLVEDKRLYNLDINTTNIPLLLLITKKKKV